MPTLTLAEKLEDLISDLRHRKSKAYNTKFQLDLIDELATGKVLRQEDFRKFGQDDFVSTTLAEVTMKIHGKGPVPKIGGWYNKPLLEDGSHGYQASPEFSEAWRSIRRTGK